MVGHAAGARAPRPGHPSSRRADADLASGCAPLDRRSRDRRRVLLRMRPAALAGIAQAHEAVQRALHATWSRYSTEQLELLIDFAARSAQSVAACAEEIQIRRRDRRAK